MQEVPDRVNGTDDGNTIGRLAEPKIRPGRADILRFGPALLRAFTLPKTLTFRVLSSKDPEFILMKSATKAPLSVTMARQAITTNMAKASIEGHR